MLEKGEPAVTSPVKFGTPQFKMPEFQSGSSVRLHLEQEIMPHQYVTKHRSFLVRASVLMTASATHLVTATTVKETTAKFRTNRWKSSITVY